MNAWTVPGYTESRELGSGTSGRVVLAVHEATGVPVAVKYLAERLRGDHAFVRGFRGEARLLGGLGSPYAVRLYEYVESPHGAAIVMELVDGMALRALLRQEGATEPEAALTVLKGSLLGLADAHRAGLVHRDYKPENVLIAADGSSKLVDFGVAAGRGSSPEVAGTPSYMAPEQWQGEPASPTADVYAATVTFYECLTGRKPYTGENIAELALCHVNAPVPDEDVPEPVRPLLRSGLAKSPSERPRDAAAFVAELERIARAAYGEDWEERGRRRLAALAALLPLLLPSNAGDAAGGAASATTALGGAHASDRRPGARARGRGAAPGHRRPRRLRLKHGLRPGPGSGPRSGRDSATGAAGAMAVAGSVRLLLLRRGPTAARPFVVAAAVAALLAGGLFSLVLAADPDGGGSVRTGARITATTSALPGLSPPPVIGDSTTSPAPSRPGAADAVGIAAPGPTRSPSASSSSAAPETSSGSTPGASASSSAVPTTSGTAPTPTATSSPRPTPTPTPTATGSGTDSPVRVKSVAVSDFQQTPPEAGDEAAPRKAPGGTGATATVEIATDGPGPLTLVISWYTSDSRGELGVLDGSETFQLGGSRHYTVASSHSFTGEGCYLGADAATDPGAPGGGSWRQILDRRCASSS